jgi:DnaJ domain
MGKLHYKTAYQRFFEVSYFIFLVGLFVLFYLIISSIVLDKYAASTWPGFSKLLQIYLSLWVVKKIGTSLIQDYPDRLANFLYLRIHLKVKITWAKFEEISFIFIPYNPGKWYPLKDLNNIPKNLRKRFILEFAERIINERNANQEDSYEDYSDYSSSYEGEFENDETTYNDDEVQRRLDILNLEEINSFDDIKNAYIREIKKYHPDKHERRDSEFKKEAESKSKQINEAYQFLKKHYKFT